MNNLPRNINSINWLKAMGVEYYFTVSNFTGSNKALIPARHAVSAHDVNATLITQASPVLNKEKAGNSDNFRKNTNFMIETAYSDSIKLARKLADSSRSLTELKSNILNFEGCSLKKFASNTVFARGVIGSEVMLIGEAPGASEDATGIPFCGESGKLLDKMLSCIGLSAEVNAYITNTVFWRPPANRAPTQEEIDICRPFVEKHISLINPVLIILVGSTAATALLGKHAGITKIRQEYYMYSNKYLPHPVPTTAIFHPAYLLRQPIQKKTTWYDLLNIQKFITQNAK